MRAAAVVVLVLALSGCAPQASTLGEMGCRTADEYLPELDAVAEGGEATEDLNDRLNEEFRLDYFDADSRGWFRLLAEVVRDEYGDGYTAVDIDYDDTRDRLISYCEGDVGWTMTNA